MLLGAVYFFLETWLVLLYEIISFPMTCQQELISLHPFYCNNHPTLHVNTGT
jgi:hypothetical protein